MRFTIFVMLLCMSLSSCASLLNPKYQKVAIQTNAKDAKIYVDDEYAGQGRNVKTKLKRDLRAKQIKVEREGYKTKYKAYSQSKKSPITYANIPFALVLFVTPFIDNMAKAYDYEKSMRVAITAPLPERTPGQKYLYLSKASFEIDENNLKFETIRLGKKAGKNKTKNTVTNDEALKIDYSIFDLSINKFLKENGFVDTSKQVLRSKTNTLYLTANVKELTVYKNFPRTFLRGTPMHVVAKPVVEWMVYDVYNQEKFKTQIAKRSDEFTFNFLDSENPIMKAVTQAVEDAIVVSLLELLEKKEVQTLLDQETIQAPGFEPIVLNRPDSTASDIETALQASVTIQHEKGHGSGLILSRDGYIVTNYHVVAGQDELTVILHNSEKRSARVVRSNEFADLALLKVEAGFSKAFLLPSQKNYQIGQNVFSIGAPASVELGQTVSKGIISGLRRHDELNWLQTDVSTNFGNSGGPLINEAGELIGVVNSKIVGFGVEGIAFAIPAWEVLQLLGVGYGEWARK